MSSSSLLFTHYRLAHKNDCLDKNLYPLLTHKHRVLTQKCAVCHVFIGRWGDIINSGSFVLLFLFFKRLITYLVFLDGIPPTTRLLRVTHVSSVTNAFVWCTTTLKAINWENSWPIPMWTGVPLINGSHDLLLYNTVTWFIFQKEMVWYLQRHQNFFFFRVWFSSLS